jgi:hypothetical protein
MCTSNGCIVSYEPHVELVMTVFKTQDASLLISLENFLTLLPTTACTKVVLQEAAYRLASTDTETYHWLLTKAPTLAAELDMLQFLIESADSEQSSIKIDPRIDPRKAKNYD